MKKLYETILGLLSSLIIFSSPTESKKIASLANDYHIPDVPKISSLNQVELISTPPPLTLQQADFDTDKLFARHGSHSSHASHTSHASHSSHASHYSGSTSPPKTPETTTPLEPKETEKSVPGTAPSSKPSDDGSKAWNTSAEWVKDPYKLYRREVIIFLKDNSKFQGMVTECKDDSIQVTRKISGSGEMKQWVNLKDVKAILWR